jgi:hypothetical protein
MVRLSCPSCNTSFALAELPADRRAHCPRCGDVFPLRTFTEEASANGHPPSAFRPPASERRARGLWSVQRTIAVALAMGLVGLLAGLGVYYANGGFKSKPVPEPESLPLIAATPPTQLVGLGYLPADTNIAFVVQPGPALAYAERLKQDPRELFTKAGIPRQLFDAIAGMGLTLPQIDHLAGGVNADEGRFTFVLVLRRPPADEDDFLQKLKAKRQPGPKARYDVSLAGIPLPLMLARVSPTVWVFGLNAKKEVEAVDRGGYGPGGKHFSQPLAEMIAQRVPPDAAAWLATNDERWAEMSLVQTLLGQMVGKKEALPILAKGRAIVASLSLEDPPRLRLFVKAADEATGQQVREYFAKKATADDKARHGGAGELAFFDVPIEPVATLATLLQFLSDAGQK